MEPKIKSVLLLLLLYLPYGANENIHTNNMKRIERLESLVKAQNRRIEDLENSDIEKTKTIITLQKQLKTLDAEVEHSKALSKNGTRAMYSEYACREQLLSLSCSGGKTISINTAYFGKYQDASCIDTCCGPHPTDDCKVSAEEGLPVYWDLLVDECQNKTSCVVEVPPASLETCPDPNTSDFLSVDFSCLPEETSHAIGFTASRTGNIDVESGNIIIFDSIETNLGGHFNAQSGIFICPLNGIYAFSLTIRTHNGGAICNIMHNGNMLTGAVANERYFQGSSFVVINCTSGDRVWAEAKDLIEYIDGEPYKPSSFSGFFIYAY